jgi:hypothetical protein
MIGKNPIIVWKLNKFLQMGDLLVPLIAVLTIALFASLGAVIWLEVFDFFNRVDRRWWSRLDPLASIAKSEPTTTADQNPLTISVEPLASCGWYFYGQIYIRH